MTDEGTYVPLRQQRPITLAEGVVGRLVTTARQQVSWVILQPGATAPVHTHDEEQIGLVLAGEIDFTLGVERRLLRATDAYVAPSGIPHGGTAGPMGCTLLDVFNPPRISTGSAD